jgi:hypothetical protein
MIKHVLSYTLVSIIAIRFTLKKYHSFRTNPKYEFSQKGVKRLQIFTLLVIGGLLFTVRIGQNYVIEKVETPPVQTCYYYDHYGNFIHGSRISYQCPEPEIISQEDGSFTMEFEYGFLGTRTDAYQGGSSYPDSDLYYQTTDGYAKIKIEIGYLEDGIINYRRVQEVVNNLSSEYSRDETIDNFEDQFTLVNETIRTNYFEAIMDTVFEDGEITQTKKVYHLRSQTNQTNKVDTANYYNFQEDDLSYDTVYRLYYSQVDDGLEYEIFTDIPIRDRIGEKADYLGYVRNIDGYKVLDYRWHEDKINPDIEPYNGVGDIFTFKDDGQIYHNNRHFEFHTNNVYQQPEKFDLSILTSSQNYNEANYNSTTWDYQTDISYYQENAYFKGKHDYQYTLTKTSYGYQIKKFGNDGYIGTEGLYNHSSEVLSSNRGIDDSIISYDNPQHLIYKNQPVFDVNEMLKYLLNEVN